MGGNHAQVLHNLVDFGPEKYPADGKLDGYLLPEYSINTWFVYDGRLYRVEYSEFVEKDNEITDKNKLEKDTHKDCENVMKTIKVH